MKTGQLQTNTTQPTLSMNINRTLQKLKEVAVTTANFSQLNHPFGNDKLNMMVVDRKLAPREQLQIKITGVIEGHFRSVVEII